MTITFLVPTIGRPSLIRTLQSIETQPGDEILVVAKGATLGLQSLCDDRPEIKLLDCEPGGDWGHTERNFATPYAKCHYLAHIDDDDIYVKGHRALMADAMERVPWHPTIFRMRYPNGITLWERPVIECGQVGTPMMLIPNVPSKLGTWMPYVGGDAAFLETSKWAPYEYVWREEVIALLGHD